jgi:hypothetical protein
VISVGMESAIGTALWHCRFAGVFQTCSFRTFLLWVFFGALFRRYLAQVALPGSALTRIALCLPGVQARDAEQRQWVVRTDYLPRVYGGPDIEIARPE